MLASKVIFSESRSLLLLRMEVPADALYDQMPRN
jgi:hypothetical protein